MTVDVKWNGTTLTISGEMVGQSFVATGSRPWYGLTRSDLSALAEWELKTRPDPWLFEQKERERKLAGMIPAKVE